VCVSAHKLLPRTHIAVNGQRSNESIKLLILVSKFKLSLFWCCFWL